MSDFSFDYVRKVCPELTKAECEAVRDHVLDTHNDNEIYPEVVRVAARSLFPYQATPKDSVVLFDRSNYIRTAIKHLQNADADISKMKSKTDNLAQIQLDIQCCIHYLLEEQESRHG
jgi:hypothetical protein